MALTGGLRLFAALLLALGLAACRSGGSAAPAPRDAGARPPPAAPEAGAASVGPAGSGCPPAAARRPPAGPSATAVRLQTGQPGVEVLAAVYPHPDYEGRPWSQWGQGLVLPDGRFLSAVGDHRGPDGNGYFYLYEPAARTLTMFGDVLSAVEHAPGAWGYGKVHAQLVGGPCGDVYAATYWGSRRGLAYGPTYQGDVLLRLDPDAATVTSLGVPVVHRGIPSLAGWSAGGLVYGEAVDPSGEHKRGGFFVYDLARRRVVVVDERQPHVGFRNIMVDSRGAAYFSAGDGALWSWLPGADAAQLHDARLPGAWLRASTQPAPDGTVYGATREPDRLFALEPSGAIRDLGPARGYVASLALHPSGDRIFYVPDAHGKSWQQGTPLVSVDTATGEQTVVVELNPAAERELGLRLGGSYNVAVDPTGRRVFVGANAGDPADRDAFGEVVLLVVDLP